MKPNQVFEHGSNASLRFAQVPSVKFPRSRFDMTHTKKGSFLEGGLLVPFDLVEVLPGDTWQIDATIFCRLSTMIVPMMDNLYLDTFYFFCPNRLVWTNWERFCGERDPDPDSSIDYTIPQYETGEGGFHADSLATHFGLPYGKPASGTAKFNALPFRMYNLIYNEWFRDQNLIDSAVVDLDDGDDAYADYRYLRRRAKRADYFTSCLPWPQKGDNVLLPLGNEAPVLGIGALNQVFGSSNVTVYESDGTSSVYTYGKSIDTGAANTDVYLEGTAATGGYPNVRADLTNATAATINELREAFQIQRLLERDARSGSRYIEQLRAHWGVVSPDFRLQRPEFLGGESAPMVQETVAQTTYQGTETYIDAKGSLASNGLLVNRTAITKSVVEHGYIMGLMSIRSEINYQQGVDKHWLRQTRYDFYMPVLANLGEQAVESREIWFSGTGDPDANPPTLDYSIFGYQERWAEYRFCRSLVVGQLASDVPSTLDWWHLSQDFASRPTLSQTFIEEDPPLERVCGVVPSTTTPAFIYDAYIKAFATRVMPVYSVPGLIDHF